MVVVVVVVSHFVMPIIAIGTVLSGLYKTIDYLYKKRVRIKNNKQEAQDICEYLYDNLLPDLKRLDGDVTAQANPQVQQVVNKLSELIEEMKTVIDGLDSVPKHKSRFASGSSNSASIKSISQSAYADSNHKQLARLKDKIYQQDLSLSRKIAIARDNTETSCKGNVETSHNSGAFDFYPNKEKSLIMKRVYCETHKVEIHGNLFSLQITDEEKCSSYGLSLDDMIKEIKILGRLNHEFMGRYVNHFPHTNPVPALCILMELTEGRKLSQIIGRSPFLFSAERKKDSDTVERHGRLSIWLRQLCDALECLHENEICHSDLRPENIFMNIDTEDLKITNICVLSNAIRRSKSRSRFHDTSASIYMSPERLESGTFDSQDDMWALGCIFAELIKGFRFETPLSLENKVNLSNFLDDLTTKSPSVGPIVCQLLSHNPAKRLNAKNTLKLPSLYVQVCIPHCVHCIFIAIVFMYVCVIYIICSMS